MREREIKQGKDLQRMSTDPKTLVASAHEIVKKAILHLLFKSIQGIFIINHTLKQCIIK